MNRTHVYDINVMVSVNMSQTHKRFNIPRVCSFQFKCLFVRIYCQMNKQNTRRFGESFDIEIWNCNRLDKDNTRN